MSDNRDKNKAIQDKQKETRKAKSYSDADGMMRFNLEHQAHLDRMAKVLKLSNVKDMVGSDAMGDVVKDIVKRKVSLTFNILAIWFRPARLQPPSFRLHNRQPPASPPTDTLPHSLALANTH